MPIFFASSWILTLMRYVWVLPVTAVD
jgi:hypothetical protein